jgi:(2R)-ethylmalonyl-CoA mutase
MDEAWEELSDVQALGGAFEAIDELKSRLVRSEVERTRRIESGELPVVGVNRFTTSEESPLGGSGSILRVDPGVEAALVDDVRRWRAARDDQAVGAALETLRRAAESDTNIMPPTIALAHAGGTTGEWSATLRDVFGEYRAPTGVAGAAGLRGVELSAVNVRIRSLGRLLGGPPKLLVAKPGLDGHSNGAEQVAVAARDAGFEVIYQGIRLTPAQIAAAARDEDVDVVGLSILSGSHLELVPEVIGQLRSLGVDAPVVVGGIIPASDEARLRAEGVAAIYTPKDFELGRIMADLAALVEARAGADPHR